VNLPVPPAIRSIEAVEEEKRQAMLAKLKDSGVDLSVIPAVELESGEGEVIKAHQHWIRHLEHLKKLGKEKRVEQLQDLRKRIEDWRSDAAVKFRMAPTDVMPEHMVVKVAYTSASSRIPMETDALHAAGVRSAGVKELVSVLRKWSEEVADPLSSFDSAGLGSVRNMTFPEETVFTPSQPWPMATYKPHKKSGKAAWETSYERFAHGEHPQSIAITPVNGRPIQLGTVVGHIFDALLLGKPVSLHRLAAASPAPNQDDWTTLQQLECRGGPEMDVVKNNVKMSEFLRPVMGDEFIDTPYNERKEEDIAKYSRWCESLKWYMNLRRVGYIPSFA